MRLLVVPLSKALHAALLLSTQEEMGTCEGRFVSRGAKLRVSGCILPRELRWLSRRIWTVKGPMTREGTCQSLQSRALSLDVDSKQWLYLYLYWSHNGGWGLFSILNECVKRVWPIRRRLIITSYFLFVHPEWYFSSIWGMMACNLLPTSLSHRSCHKDEIKGWIFIKNVCTW